jgi:hypothetical protein
MARRPTKDVKATTKVAISGLPRKGTKQLEFPLLRYWRSRQSSSALDEGSQPVSLRQSNLSPNRHHARAGEQWPSIRHVRQVRNVLSSLSGINRSHAQPTRRCNEGNVVRLSRAEIDVKILTPVIAAVSRSVAPRAENPMRARRHVDEGNPFRDGASRSTVDLDISDKGDVCALGAIKEHASFV